MCDGESASALLPAWLGESALIAWGVGHREACSVDEFDAAPLPEVIQRGIALDHLGGIAVDVVESLDRESFTSGTVGAGALAGAGPLLLDESGLHLAKDLPAGGLRGEDLQEKGPKDKRKGEEALPAVGPALWGCEEGGGDPWLEEGGESAEGSALPLINVLLHDAQRGWGFSSSEEGREIGEERVAGFHI